MSIEVKGLQESLRTLGKLEPELKKEFAKNVQRIVRPLKNTIDERIPRSSPLSGWDHNGPKGWNPKKVAVRTDTRLPRRRPGSVGGSTLQVIKIVTKGSSVAIADMAGKAGGNSSKAPAARQRPNFSRALTAALGEPSRFMWRDIDRSVDEIAKQLEPLIRDVERATNQALMRIR
jgi:hypothetical protein